MMIDEEVQDNNIDDNEQDLQEEEEYDFTGELQHNNGQHSHSNSRLESEKGNTIKSSTVPTQTTPQMSLLEIKNSYIKENLTPQTKKPKEETKESTEPVKKEITVFSTKEKIETPAKEITITTTIAKETTVANTKEAETPTDNQKTNGAAKKHTSKPKEVKQPRVISRELLKPIESRDEASRQHVDELLSSIKKQKAEIPRLERIQKGPRIETIVSDSGERILVKKRAEQAKTDLRTKINVAEDSSKSILNRISKKSF